MKGRKNNDVIAVLGSFAIVAIGAALLFLGYVYIPRTPFAQNEIRAAIDFLSLMDMALIVFLLYTYFKSYLELRSKFTAGLLVFVGAIMLFVMTTSRTITGLLDPLRCASGCPTMLAPVQVIDIIPLVFSTVALAMLAYLSNE